MNRDSCIVALITLILAGVSACTSNSSNPTNAATSLVNPGTQTSLSEQRVTEDFKREGIKIVYSTFGRTVEAIEVSGYAPVWGNSAAAVESAYKVAELDAKRKLNDFINKESIQSSTSVNMITRSLEKVQDNKNNAIANNISVSDDEAPASDSRTENRAIREDALTISRTLNQTITTSSKGILGGLRMTDSEVVNGGRNVKVTMTWEKANEKAIIDIRRSMMK